MKNHSTTRNLVNSLFSLLFLLQINSTLNAQATYSEKFITTQGKIASVVESPYSDGYYVLHNFNVSGLPNYLLKVNFDAQVEKSFIINFTNNNYVKIISTYDNNLVLGGGSYISKFDTAGNVIWSHGYGVLGKDLIQTIDSGFVMIGDVSSSDAAGVVKVDKNGNLEWYKSYLNTSADNYFNKVIQDYDGNLYLLQGHAPSYIIKLDSLGNVIWAKKFTKNNGVTYEIMNDLLFDSLNNEVYISTYRELAKVDLSGSLLWDHTYNYECNGTLFKLDTLICRLGNDIASPRGNVLNLMDASGNTYPSKHYPWDSLPYFTYLVIKAILPTINNNFIAFTQRNISAGPFSFDTRAGIIVLDSFFNAPCHSVPYQNPIYTSNSLQQDNVVLTVSNPIGGQNNVALTFSVANIYDSIYCTTPTNIESFEFHNKIIFYPNPSKGEIIISVNELLNENLTFNLTDLLGRKLKYLKIVLENTSLNLEVPNGIYFATISTNTNIYTTKIIVER